MLNQYQLIKVHNNSGTALHGIAYTFSRAIELETIAKLHYEIFEPGWTIYMCIDNCGDKTIMKCDTEYKEHIRSNHNKNNFIKRTQLRIHYQELTFRNLPFKVDNMFSFFLFNFISEDIFIKYGDAIRDILPLIYYYLD